jgi:hypothetical protein
MTAPRVELSPAAEKRIAEIAVAAFNGEDLRVSPIKLIENAIHAALRDPEILAAIWPMEPIPEAITAGGEAFMQAKDSTATTEWTDARNIYKAMRRAHLGDV